MFGPLLIFDKSFLQMLKADEVFELTLLFSPVDTPTLVHEIIADLKLPMDERRIPRDVVRALARKMITAGGYRPAGFRNLALANLLGHEISMIGQVPVDTSAPNVLQSEGMLLYDAAVEQRIWTRWSDGDFTVQDEDAAISWRQTIEKIDLRAVGESWKEFVWKNFPTAKSISTLAAEASRLLDSPHKDVQIELLGIATRLLDAPNVLKTAAFNRLLHEDKSIREFAPYAASVLWLYLTFIGGLARGFIGPRKSHYIDLQYLFYAPFCMVFASSDRFHRDMWTASSGINSFAWGPDLKTELSARRASRIGTETERARGFYPEEVEGSLVTDFWRRYMRPKYEILRGIPETPTRFEDLDPATRSLLEKAKAKFDRGLDKER